MRSWILCLAFLVVTQSVLCQEQQLAEAETTEAAAVRSIAEYVDVSTTKVPEAPAECRSKYDCTCALSRSEIVIPESLSEDKQQVLSEDQKEILDLLTNYMIPFVNSCVNYMRGGIRVYRSPCLEDHRVVQFHKDTDEIFESLIKPGTNLTELKAFTYETGIELVNWLNYDPFEQVTIFDAQVGTELGRKLTLQLNQRTKFGQNLIKPLKSISAFQDYTIVKQNRINQQVQIKVASSASLKSSQYEQWQRINKTIKYFKSIYEYANITDEETLKLKNETDIEIAAWEEYIRNNPVSKPEGTPMIEIEIKRQEKILPKEQADLIKAIHDVEDEVANTGHSTLSAFVRFILSNAESLVGKGWKPVNVFGNVEKAIDMYASNSKFKYSEELVKKMDALENAEKAYNEKKSLSNQVAAKLVKPAAGLLKSFGSLFKGTLSKSKPAVALTNTTTESSGTDDSEYGGDSS